MVNDNISICVDCGKRVKDDSVTKWNKEAEPFCKDCFKGEKKMKKETKKEILKDIKMTTQIINVLNPETDRIEIMLHQERIKALNWVLDL